MPGSQGMALDKGVGRFHKELFAEEMGGKIAAHLKNHELSFGNGHHGDSGRLFDSIIMAIADLRLFDLHIITFIDVIDQADYGLFGAGNDACKLGQGITIPREEKLDKQAD